MATIPSRSRSLSSSSSSTSYSSSDPPYTVIKDNDDGHASKKYDVFLNFRGDDTRKNILGHLRAALSEKGLQTFVDDDQLARGQHISPQLLQAIEDSSCSIVILSPNYASSSWCLDELVHILDCMKTRARVVIPVFYHVDPSDVRKQVGSFGEVFAKHDLEGDHSERVNKWRVALTEITSLAGLDLKNYRDEANFIREIVGEVSSKLTSTVSSSNICGETQSSTVLNVFLDILRGIFSLLFIFLVIFPLFGLFFFKVVVPILNQIFSFPDDPFSWKINRLNR